MAKNFKPVFTLNVAHASVKIVNADSTGQKTILTANVTEGTRIEKLWATSDDTSPRVLMLELYDGSTTYNIGAVTIGALSGTDGAAASVNLLNSTINPWAASDGTLVLKAGWSLRCHMIVAVTAAKTVTVTAMGGDFA